MQHWDSINICKCRHWSWNIRNRERFGWHCCCTFAQILFVLIRISIGCLLTDRICVRLRFRSLADTVSLLFRIVGIRLCEIFLFGCFLAGSTSHRCPRFLGCNSIYDTWCGIMNRRRTDYTINENSLNNRHTPFSKCL